MAPCGGVDRRLLLAQEVVIHGTRPVPGIVGTKPPHLTSGDEAKKVVDIEDIAIDNRLYQRRAASMGGARRPGYICQLFCPAGKRTDHFPFPG